MRQKNQVMMFSDSELSLIKNTFGGDGEDFLYLIRNVLLQFPMTKEDKVRLKAVMNSDVYKVVKKRILPEIDPDAPFGQLADLYQTLTGDLQRKTPDEMVMFFEAKQIEIDYLRQQFDQLMDVDRDFLPTIILNDLAKVSPLRMDRGIDFANHTARNFILGYVDASLIQLKVIAGEQKETPDEQKKRLTRNSSK